MPFKMERNTSQRLGDVPENHVGKPELDENMGENGYIYIYSIYNFRFGGKTCVGNADTSF